MRKLKFYVCPACGNVLTAMGEAELSCCGRRLAPLPAAPADAAHTPTVEPVETEYYLTYPHPMDKGHTLAFAAAVSYDRMVLVPLYPEQAPALRLPQLRRAQLYTYCTKHGLFVSRLP